MQNSDSEYSCVLNFFGGEPLLRFDVLKEMVEYTESAYNNRQVAYSITTNGTIFDRTIAYFIKKHNISCLFSTDGPEKFSENRRFKNNLPSYNKVIKNIKRFNEAGIAMALRATISSDCDSLVEIYDFLEKQGIKFAAVRAYQSVNQSDLADYQKSILNFTNQYDLLYNYYSAKIDRDEEIHCYSILNEIRLIESKHKQTIGCSAGQHLFAITNSGDIFTCEHLAYSKDYSTGNIETGVDKNKLKAYKPQNIDEISRCKDCWIRNVCAGGCFTSNMEVKNEDSMNAECEIKKLYWEFILKLYCKIKSKSMDKEK